LLFGRIWSQNIGRKIPKGIPIPVVSCNLPDDQEHFGTSSKNPIKFLATLREDVLLQHKEGHSNPFIEKMI